MNKAHHRGGRYQPLDKFASLMIHKEDKEEIIKLAKKHKLSLVDTIKAMIKQFTYWEADSWR